MSGPLGAIAGDAPVAKTTESESDNQTTISKAFENSLSQFALNVVNNQTEDWNEMMADTEQDLT